jgi:thioredoxin 1
MVGTFRRDPISIQLVTTIGCSRCLAAKRTLTELLERVQDEYRIEVQELDLLEQPELAAEYGIWSTPALIIDGQLAFTGAVKEGALRQKLAEARDAPNEVQRSGR